MGSHLRWSSKLVTRLLKLNIIFKNEPLKIKKNSDILYGRYETKNMDKNLQNNVQNIITKINSNASFVPEVIYVITWKDLKIDPTRTEVLF